MGGCSRSPRAARLRNSTGLTVSLPASPLRAGRLSMHTPTHTHARAYIMCMCVLIHAQCAYMQTCVHRYAQNKRIHVRAHTRVCTHTAPFIVTGPQGTQPSVLRGGPQASPPSAAESGDGQTAAQSPWSRALCQQIPGEAGTKQTPLHPKPDKNDRSQRGSSSKPSWRQGSGRPASPGRGGPGQPQCGKGKRDGVGGTTGCLLLPLPPRGQCVHPARMLLRPGFTEKPSPRLFRGKGERGGAHLPRLSHRSKSAPRTLIPQRFAQDGRPRPVPPGQASVEAGAGLTAGSASWSGARGPRAVPGR